MVCIGRLHGGGRQRKGVAQQKGEMIFFGDGWQRQEAAPYDGMGAREVRERVGFCKEQDP